MTRWGENARAARKGFSDVERATRAIHRGGDDIDGLHEFHARRYDSRPIRRRQHGVRAGAIVFVRGRVV